MLRELYINSITTESTFEEEMFLEILETVDIIDRQTYIEDIRRKCKKVNRLEEFNNLLNAWMTRNAELEKEHKTSVTCMDGVFHPVKEVKQIEAISLSDVMNTEYEALVYPVRDLISYGVTLVSAPPKYFKSFLVAFIGLCVALGIKFFGKDTIKSGVIYCDLENDIRIAKERFNKLLGEKEAPKNFYIISEVPSLEQGFTATMSAFLDTHKDIHLLIVDVFQMIKYNKRRNETDYETDYRSICELKELAKKYNLAIIIVSHNRKMIDTNDPFANIHGSTAMFGAVDEAIVIYKEKRSDPEATISFTGRTIESIEFKAKFNTNNFQWELLGNVEEWEQKQEEREYNNDYFVKAVKKLLEVNNGIIKGRLGTIIDDAKKLGINVYEKPTSIGKKMNKYRIWLEQFDNIVVTEISSGTASKIFEFSYGVNPFDTKSK